MCCWCWVWMLSVHVLLRMMKPEYYIGDVLECVSGILECAV